MRLKRLSAGFSAALLTISSLLTMGFTLPASALSTCTWTGGGTDSKWTTVANWSGCGANTPAYPQTGDSVVFNNTSLGANVTVDVDAPVSLATISFTGTNNTYYFKLTNSAITITSGITSDITNYTTEIDTPLILGANATFGTTGTGTGQVQIGNSTTSNSVALGGHTLTLSSLYAPSLGNSTLTGTGNVIAASGASPYLLDSPNWTAGSFTVNSGSGLQLNPTTLGTAIALTVQSGGYVYLCAFNGANFANPLTVGGRGTSFGAGSYTGALVGAASCGHGGSGASFDAHGSVVLTGNVTLTASTTFSSVGEITVSGPLHGNFTLTMESGQVGKLTISSSDNKSATPNGGQTSAVQTTTYSDNLPSTTIFVDANNVGIVDGTYGDTSVADGGTVKGTGTVNSLDVASGGTVAPGHSPGKLTVVTTLTLEKGAIFSAELKDKADGNFDQIVVGSSSITTGNAVTLGDTTGGPKLNLSLYDGYSIKAGDTFKIIDNQSATDVSGTFQDLPEGATVTGPNGYVFKISYKGGDGNDVVLTAVTVPKTPDTGFAATAAHPGVTLGVSALAALGIFAIARRTSKISSKRR